MKVSEAMTAQVVTATPQTTVAEVARTMSQIDSGVVPVMDDGKVVGVITDRDIVVRGLAEGKNLESARVTDVMTTSIRTVREDSTVNDALTLMTTAEIRRVPVVNNRNEIVGILSLGDIASEGNQDGKVGKAVEDISEAPPNN